MQINYINAQQILQKSTILFDKETLYSQIDKIANNINDEIVDEIPLFLSVMNGGMFFAAEILKRITKPVLCDYIHASRYGNEQFGATHITWYRQPKLDMICGKHVYILDDILDEGYTLAEIQRFLISAGAKSCKLVVLVNKEIGKIKPVIADYVGINAPNHFLFGFGMDIYGLYRQLPSIYAYNQ